MMQLIVETSYADTEKTATQELDGGNFTAGSSLQDDLILPSTLYSADQFHFSLASNYLEVRNTGASVEGLASDAVIQWKAGELITLGHHKLILLKVNNDSVHLQIQLFSEPSFLKSINPVTEDSWSFFTRRRMAYLGIIIVLACALVLPLMSHFQASDPSQDNEQWLGPENAFWSSGPLSNPHQHPDIDNDCTACHTDLFVQVKDEQCLACHQSVNNHAFDDPHEMAGVNHARCATCHKEHGTPSNLINFVSAGCVNCHSDTQSWLDKPNQLMPVSAFNKDQHPNFSLNLLQFDNNKWTEKRLKVTASQAEILTQKNHPSAKEHSESSNLKFSHQVHMDTGRVNKEGKALDCGSCHQLDNDNEHFQPITMETSCLSCHTLGIDMQDIERQLPHGSTDEVVRALKEFLAYQYVNPEFRKTRQEINVRSRGIPGKPRIRSTLTIDPCDDINSLYSCVDNEVGQLAEIQFEKSGCITCHEVQVDATKPVEARWQVLPIKLQDDWYAKHSFNHKAHLEGGFENQGQACSSCHFAGLSDDTSDVLIPGIDNCLQCHTQGQSIGVELDCLSCHAYHVDTMPIYNSETAPEHSNLSSKLRLPSPIEAN